MFLFGACSNSALPPIPSPVVSGVMDLPTTTRPKNFYPLKHNNEDTQYVIATTDGSQDDTTLLELYEQKSNCLLQSITIDAHPTNIEIEDVNLDGFSDVVANTGFITVDGVSNVTHKLYIWDISSCGFVEVKFHDFEILSRFETHEGYIVNRVTFSEVFQLVQKLSWFQNHLYLISEEFYDVT
jgi:hypothetical protein